MASEVSNHRINIEQHFFKIAAPIVAGTLIWSLASGWDAPSASVEVQKTLAADLREKIAQIWRGEAHSSIAPLVFEVPPSPSQPELESSKQEEPDFGEGFTAFNADDPADVTLLVPDRLVVVKTFKGTVITGRVKATIAGLVNEGQAPGTITDVYVINVDTNEEDAYTLDQVLAVSKQLQPVPPTPAPQQPGIQHPQAPMNNA